MQTDENSTYSGSEEMHTMYRDALPLDFVWPQEKKPESENEKRGKCKQYLCSIENILFFITNRARTALPADTLKSCQTISNT